jgi:hypothetical protein
MRDTGTRDILLLLIGSDPGCPRAEIGSILTTQALCGAISNIPGGLWSTRWPQGPADGDLTVPDRRAYLLMGFSHEYWLPLTCAALAASATTLASDRQSASCPALPDRGLGRVDPRHGWQSVTRWRRSWPVRCSPI